MTKPSSALIFDAETNGFLDKLNKVHSLVCMNNVNKVMYSCTDSFYQGEDCADVGAIKQGVKTLECADLIAGHNIVKFDIPAITKVYPEFSYKNCFDTMIASKLVFPDISKVDLASERKGQYTIPKELKQKPHSLAAWGYRLGVFKGDYGEKENAFEVWTPEMQRYCEQDVKVTSALYDKLLNPKNDKRKISEDALKTEIEFAKIIQLQEARGVKFNQDKAIALLTKLKTRRDELIPEFRKYFKNKIKKERFVPKCNNKKFGYVKDEPVTKKKLIKFNPSSRQMIIEQLIKFYDWTPLEYTDKGRPKLDFKAIEIMAETPSKYPFAPMLEEYFIIDRLLGQLSDGEKSWLNHVRDNNIIYGSVNTQGTVTSRCTHNNPNLAQIPAVGKPFGLQCRELFEPRKGYVLVGVDAKGLELRCLANYMEDPEYTELILHGDIHTFNQNILKEIAPNISRDIAKTWIYAFLYGASDKLLGEKVGKSRKTGKDMRAKFLEKLPKLGELVQMTSQMAGQGYMFALDGRYIPISSKHVALNYLLQSAGAIVMKKALCLLYEDLCAFGWVHGREYAFVLNVHDEIQAEVRPEWAETYGVFAKSAIKRAGNYYKFTCPLDGDVKVGKNWAQTH